MLFFYNYLDIFVFGDDYYLNVGGHVLMKTNIRQPASVNQTIQKDRKQEFSSLASDVSNISSLALDWMTDTLYWTNERLNTVTRIS